MRLTVLQKARERLKYGADWSRVNDVAAGLWFILQRERSVQRGLGVPVRDIRDEHGRLRTDSDEIGRINALAVDMLRHRHPEITVTVHKDDLFLVFREDLAPLQESSADFRLTRQALEASLGLDLVERTEINRALPGGDGKHTRPRWPGALEGRAAEDVSAEEMAAFQLQVEEWKRQDAEDAATAAALPEGIGMDLPANIGLDGNPIAGSAGAGIPLTRAVYDGEGRPIGATGTGAPELHESARKPLRSLMERLRDRMRGA